MSGHRKDLRGALGSGVQRGGANGAPAPGIQGKGASKE